MDDLLAGAAFEEDLANRLARLYAVRAERRLMGRLQRVFGVGWFAVTGAIVAVPVLGTVAFATCREE
ncbi:MAG TPA: hypothetical protein VGL99_28895 [Chloroflexota bacterium]|jgi:hypothetical protein